MSVFEKLVERHLIEVSSEDLNIGDYRVKLQNLPGSTWRKGYETGEVFKINDINGNKIDYFSNGSIKTVKKKDVLTYTLPVNERDYKGWMDTIKSIKSALNKVLYSSNIHINNPYDYYEDKENYLDKTYIIDTKLLYNEDDIRDWDYTVKTLEDAFSKVRIKNLRFNKLRRIGIQIVAVL